MRKQTAWALLALPMSFVLLGAECSPTERPCNNPGSCDTESEYPACIQYCVPQIPREEALGETCVSDPCHPDLVTAGTAILCPSGLSCLTPAGSDHGVCVDVRESFLAACDPGPWNSCSTGLYCRPFEDEGCDGNPTRPSIPYYADAGGVCTTPIREGGFCDANWGQEGCRVCEPGTLCSPDPERGNSLRCRRPCDVDDDCPCVDGADPSVCLGDLDMGDGEMDGLCSVCVGHLDECEYRAPNPDMDDLCAEDPHAAGCYEWLSGIPYGCCDPSDECRLVTAGGGPYPSLDTGVCCSTVSTACETTDDCCPGTVCSALTSTCEPCDQLGDPVEHGCCPRLEDRGDGICRPECDPELIDQPCPGCAGVETVWTCTDETGLECLPVDPPAPGDDTCDAVDDDCDGDIDEDYEAGASCAFGDARCDGRTFEGTKECRAGEEVCVAAEPYCVYDYATHTLVHGNYSACGQGYLDCETGGHSVCPPNSYCRVNDCWTDGMGMPFYGCWPHGAAYACIGESYGVDQICDSGMLCWTPGETNTTGFVCPTD